MDNGDTVCLKPEKAEGRINKQKLCNLHRMFSITPYLFYSGVSSQYSEQENKLAVVGISSGGGTL